MRAHIEPSLIIKAVADYYELTPAEILGRTRTAPIAWARQVAMFLTVDLNRCTYTEAGEVFDRDHSTIIYACESVRFENSLESKKQKEISAIRARIIITGTAEAKSTMLPNSQNSSHESAMQKLNDFSPLPTSNHTEPQLDGATSGKIGGGDTSPHNSPGVPAPTPGHSGLPVVQCAWCRDEILHHTNIIRSDEFWESLAKSKVPISHGVCVCCSARLQGHRYRVDVFQVLAGQIEELKDSITRQLRGERENVRTPNFRERVRLVKSAARALSSAVEQLDGQPNGAAQ